MYADLMITEHRLINPLISRTSGEEYNPPSDGLIVFSVAIFKPYPSGTELNVAGVPLLS